jgi:hypothetical protein
MGTDDGFLEIRTHGRLVNSDCSHFAIEFLLAPFAFKVDFHVVSILFLSPNIEAQLPEAADLLRVTVSCSALGSCFT